MNELIAKQIIKNKFWIVEDHGEQVATIQAVEDGTVVYVHEATRQKFPSIKVLSKEINVIFDNAKPEKKLKPTTHDVHGYPTTNKPWNTLWDVQHQFPVFTKTSKSKSFYCAGYYIIHFNSGWVKSYCPKFITLSRYEYQGPFATKEEMLEKLKAANGN
jgi:hypothetical protein